MEFHLSICGYPGRCWGSALIYARTFSFHISVIIQKHPIQLNDSSINHISYHI